LDEKKLNDCLVAIDEFHHVSVDRDNRLGEVLKKRDGKIELRMS
jgi:hypothetical protein